MLYVNLCLWDFLVVLLIVAFSVFWLLKNFIKLKRSKCGTICSGCTATSCGVKVFSGIDNASKGISNKYIEIHKL